MRGYICGGRLGWGPQNTNQRKIVKNHHLNFREAQTFGCGSCFHVAGSGELPHYCRDDTGISVQGGCDMKRTVFWFTVPYWDHFSHPCALANKLISAPVHFSLPSLMAPSTGERRNWQSVALRARGKERWRTTALHSELIILWYKLFLILYLLYLFCAHKKKSCLHLIDYSVIWSRSSSTRWERKQRNTLT